MLRGTIIAMMAVLPVSTAGAMEEEVKVERILNCNFLCEVAENAKACEDKLSPFLFVHMSNPDQPNIFGFYSAAGSTVGQGMHMDDGRWVIGYWEPSENTGPFLTLVTLSPKNWILVSVSTGKKSHVTYEASCEEQPVPKE